MRYGFASPRRRNCHLTPDVVLNHLARQWTSADQARVIAQRVRRRSTPEAVWSQLQREVAAWSKRQVPSATYA